MSELEWKDFTGWDDYVDSGDYDASLNTKSAAMVERVLIKVYKGMLQEHLALAVDDLDPYFDKAGFSVDVIDHSGNEILTKQFDLKATINRDLGACYLDIEKTREYIVSYLEGLLEYAKTCDGFDPKYEK